MADNNDLNHHHHHHHHHHKHGMDDAEKFKQKTLSASRRRKLAAKWGFRLLCLVALLIIGLCVLVYTVN